MKERRIEHTYGCSAEVFWNQIFLDDEYNRQLFIDVLHFESWRVLESKTRGDEVIRVIEAVPRVGDLPSALKRLVGEGLGYVERGIAEPAAQRYRLEVTPRSLASKLSISGELTTVPISERSCRRLYVARVEAKVFGVAGLIEDRILADIEKSYAKAAEFTNRWIAERNL